MISNITTPMILCGIIGFLVLNLIIMVKDIDRLSKKIKDVEIQATQNNATCFTSLYQILYSAGIMKPKHPPKLFLIEEHYRSLNQKTSHLIKFNNLNEIDLFKSLREDVYKVKVEDEIQLENCPSILRK